METETKKIKVRLVGTDGNSFALLGKCRQAAHKGKMPKETIAEFTQEAMKGDYNHLLVTCCKYFDVR